MIADESGGRTGLGLQRLAFALRAFIVCSFLGAVFVAVARLEHRAHASPAHRVALGAWSVLQQPDWVSDQALRALRTEAGFDAATISVLDDAGTDEVARRLGTAAGVRRVLAVQRRLPNRLVVALELRRPVARLRLPRISADSPPSNEAPVGDHPGAEQSESGDPVSADGRSTEVWIDAEGVVVDGAGLRQEGAEELPLIVSGATIEPTPGARYGEDVRAGLELAERLRRASEDHPELALVQGVDVSNWTGRLAPRASEVTLLLADDATDAMPTCRVEWGRIGARAGDDEPDFTRKRDRLLRALELSPRLRGFEVVRVAFGDLFVVPRAELAPEAR